jgi:hypothetical protein
MSRVNSKVVLQVASLVELPITYAAHKYRIEAVGVLINHLPLNADHAIHHYSHRACVCLVLQLQQLKVGLQLAVTSVARGSDGILVTI